MAAGAVEAMGAAGGAAAAGAGTGADDLSTNNNEGQDWHPQPDRMNGTGAGVTSGLDLREYLTYRRRGNVGYSSWIRDLPLHPHYAALLEHVARFVDCHPLLLHAQVLRVDVLMKSAAIRVP